MENWRKSDVVAGHSADADAVYETAHGAADAPREAVDTNEMTIQLGGVGRMLVNLQPTPGGTPDGADGPVFVDESGNRRRKLRRLGIFFGAVFGCYAVVLVFSVLGGNASAPWLGIPGEQEEGGKGGTVGPAPSGSSSLDPGVAPSLTPGSTPTVSVGATVTPSGNLSAGVSGTAEDPKTPDPTKSASGSTGGTGADPDPVDPSASTQDPVEPDPEPSVSGSGSPEPSAGTDGGGIGGPADQVAAETVRRESTTQDDTTELAAEGGP